MTIKVLGSGCANCQKLEAVVREVVKEMGLAVEVEHVRDYKDIASYGVMATPGLVINGKVVSTGKIPSKAEVANWIVAAEGR